MPWEDVSDRLPPSAYKAEDPAGTGVCHPSDGHPANLPKETTEQGSIARL